MWLHGPSQSRKADINNNMRYSEIKQLNEEPSSWTSFSLSTIYAWMETNNANTAYGNPTINDNILLMGLVGDPKMKKFKKLIKSVHKNFKELNKYKAGERISKDTKTRLMRLMTSSEAGGAAGLFYPDMTNSPRYKEQTKDAWVIGLDRLISKINDNLETDYENQFRVNTIVHEAMHRGFAVWRALVRNGQINPSNITNFILFDSQDGFNYDNEVCTGEHAIIYNTTEFADDIRQIRFVMPWYEANKAVLRTKFGLNSPGFNDKFRDLTAGDQEGEVYGVRNQLKMMLEIAYQTASNEIADVVGKKMLTAPRPPKRDNTAMAAIPAPDWNRRYAATDDVKPDIEEPTSADEQQATELIQRTIRELKSSNGDWKRIKANRQKFVRQLASLGANSQARTIAKSIAVELFRNWPNHNAEFIQSLVKDLVNS